MPGRNWEEDESSVDCKVHKIEYFPSDGCPECPLNETLADIGAGLSTESWWVQQDQDDEWIESQL